MKITLMFLVLVNLLFYGWSQWVATPPGADLVATPEPRAERLTLLAEAYPEQVAALEVDVSALELPSDSDKDGQTQTPPEPVAEVVPEPQPEAAPVTQPVTQPEPAPAQASEPVIAVIEKAPPRCVQFGPFLRLREATEAAARLRESNLEPSQRLEESEVWVGHWVFLPAFPSRAAAVAEVGRLREGGITDNYIEPSGALRNTISLGLFSNRARAETRAEKARSLGTSPQIQDRYRTGTVYWLEFDLPADQDLDISGFSTQPNRPVELKDRDCDQSG